jgi:hypothetical protein
VPHPAGFLFSRVPLLFMTRQSFLFRILIPEFYSTRWTWECTKEDVPKMGQFSSCTRRKSHRGSLHRSPRWQNAFETTGSSLWRTSGMSYY